MVREKRRAADERRPARFAAEGEGIQKHENEVGKNLAGPEPEESRLEVIVMHMFLGLTRKKRVTFVTFVTVLPTHI